MIAATFFFLSVSLEEPILPGVPTRPLVRGLPISCLGKNVVWAFSIAALTVSFSFYSFILPTKSNYSYSKACLLISYNCLTLTPPSFVALFPSIKLLGDGRFLLSKLLFGCVCSDDVSWAWRYRYACSFFWVIEHSGQIGLNEVRFYVEACSDEFWVYAWGS